jgi:hypothetical protein
MALQILAVAGFALLVFSERRRYERLEALKYAEARQERDAQYALKPQTGDVLAAPIRPPV